MEGWSQEHELLATAIDMLGENLKVSLAANGVKTRDLPNTRFPRPWEDSQGRRVQSDDADVRAFFLDSDMNFVDNQEAW